MAHYLDCRWRGLVLEEYPPALKNAKDEIVKLLIPPPDPPADPPDPDEHQVVVANMTEAEEDDDNLSGIERLAKRRRTSGDSDSGDSSTATAGGQGVMGLLEIEFHAFENMTVH